MSLGIGAIVLLAAFMHAFWNALVKGAADKTLMLGLIAVGHVVAGAVLTAVSPTPDPAVWPYIIATTVIHWGYYYLLSVAYRLGDLSVVYPIARGLTPVLIALGAWLWVGEVLPLQAWLGLGLVSLGIMVLAGGSGVHKSPGIAIVAALGLAVTIAAYSLVDGIGVRLSGSVAGYVGWIFLSEGFVAAFVLVRFWPGMRRLSARNVRLGILGGVISGLAYGLVLFAKTQASLGAVSALRETSVIFAAMIGVFWFGEGPLQRRLVSAFIVLAGVLTIGFYT